MKFVNMPIASSAKSPFVEHSLRKHISYLYICCCSVAQLCLTLLTPWTTAHQASQTFTFSQSLPKLMSIESMMPFNHLILSSILLLLPSVFPSIKVFSNESALCIKWPKYFLEFQLQHQSFQSVSGLIYLGLTSLIFLLSKGGSRVFSGTIVWKHQFFITQSSL